MKLKRSFMVAILLISLIIVVLGMLAVRAGYGSTGWFNKYPQYGHAADFSWVAGHITRYGLTERLNSISGCAIFQYQEGDTTKRFQLDGPGWLSYLKVAYQARKAPDMDSPLIITGHPANAGEHFRKCYSDRDAPGYIVDVVKVNAAP